MAEISFSDRELDIMAVLWQAGSGTVDEVRQNLPDELAYTTVLTMLRILERKGHVVHEVEGRTFRYRPLVQREQAGRSALRRLLGRVFGGSPELLLTELVSDRDLSEESLRRLRDLLDRRLKEERP